MLLLLEHTLWSVGAAGRTQDTKLHDSLGLQSEKKVHKGLLLLEELPQDREVEHGPRGQTWSRGQYPMGGGC